MINNRYPKYKALPLEGDGGWYVSITRDGVQEEKRRGFSTEMHARTWINKEIYNSVTRGLREKPKRGGAKND